MEVQQKLETEKRQRLNLTFYTSSKLFITTVLTLPFLATIVLFVHFYYVSNNDNNASRLSESLHGDTSIFSLTLNQDNRMHENGHLRPEDHIYREAVTQTLKWSITSGQRRPDGVDKTVYLVNGMSQGSEEKNSILITCGR